MLAASTPVPNNHQTQTPTPGNWYGVTQGMAAARDAVEQGRLDQAEQILKELLEFAPVEIRAWKLLARIQRQLGHIEAGIASATRALELQNNKPEDKPLASATLAGLLWRQGEYSQARAMLRLLIDQQPDSPELTALQQKWEMENPA